MVCVIEATGRPLSTGLSKRIHTAVTVGSTSLCLFFVLARGSMNSHKINLPTGKALQLPVPGFIGRTNRSGAVRRRLRNGLIYEQNSAKAPGASESSWMNFSRPDAVDAKRLNAILWKVAKGASSEW